MTINEVAAKINNTLNTEKYIFIVQAGKKMENNGLGNFVIKWTMVQIRI